MVSVGKLFPNLANSRKLHFVILGLVLLGGMVAVWHTSGMNAGSSADGDSAAIVKTQIGEPREDLADITEKAKQFVAVIESDLAPQTARQKNDAIPFTDRPISAATPFLSKLEGPDRLRAEACLAVAAIYEAGYDPDDQRPVMQVVLNRVRHPAWPNSVCEVVFQGAERATGCQFSFTCDGSMLRRQPSGVQFERAKLLAGAMLDNEVDPRVGWSTHYHTDWVHPYWSTNLDKSAAVKTHLFFRWNGWWGTKPAFRAMPSPIEPAIAAVAAFDRWHEGGLTDDLISQEDAGLVLVQPDIGGAEAALTVGKASGDVWKKPLIKPLAGGAKPGRWALDAVEMCEGKTSCRVVGWSNRANQPLDFTPESLARNPPDLVYKQELRTRTQQVYWDCSKWPKAGTSRCLGNAEQAASLSLALE